MSTAWLSGCDQEQHDCDQPGLGSKPTCAIQLCLWERHYIALFLAWWSWKAVLNFSRTVSL